MDTEVRKKIKLEKKEKEKGSVTGTFSKKIYVCSKFLAASIFWKFPTESVFGLFFYAPIDFVCLTKPLTWLLYVVCGDTQVGIEGKLTVLT